MRILKKKVDTDGGKSEWRAKSVDVKLPDQQSLLGNDSTITVSFTAYDNIGTIMNLNSSISSSVLSVNVLGLDNTDDSVQLADPLIFTLYHKAVMGSNTRNCVYWNFKKSSWSSEGCYPISDQCSDNATVCECYHLTNFAILVDIHDIALDEGFRLGLELLTILGCSVSIVCLMICLFVFTTFRSARNERSSINFNICLCLLMSELVFLLGIGQTGNATVCFAVAVSLHYLFTASFLWMLIAGFQIYVLLIEVFDKDNCRIVQYYVLGYMTPLVILLSSLLFDTLIHEESVYGGKDFCWITHNLHLILSFIAPMALVILTNFSFLCVASWKIQRKMDLIVIFLNASYFLGGYLVRKYKQERQLN